MEHAMTTNSWSEAARGEYRRACLRHAREVDRPRVAPIEPFMPPPSRIGRPRKSDLRGTVNVKLLVFECSFPAQPLILPTRTLRTPRRSVQRLPI